MCFRPATTMNVVKCLSCGAFNKPTNAVCQKCGADMTESIAQAQAAVDAANANVPTEVSLSAKPAAPKTPAAPAAPAAPKPPTV